MSDIRANKISNESGNGPINLTGQSAAKAWCNFSSLSTTSNPDMNGVRDSLNVSSIVSLAVGIDETNYSNDFANFNYAATVGSTAGGTLHFSSGIYTASTLRLTAKGSSGNNSDASINTFMAHGDLA